jgi:hypothetical protein
LHTTGVNKPRELQRGCLPPLFQPRPTTSHMTTSFVRFSRRTWPSAPQQLRAWSLMSWKWLTVPHALTSLCLEGFEIKAGNDTMVRLSRQVQAYDRVFERSWTVTVQAHLAKVEALLPSWWGLLVVEPGSALCVHRAARDNPMVEAVSAAKFLWRDEALALLEKHGLSKGMKSKPKLALFAKLADNVPLPVLLADVRAALKARTNWRDEAGNSVLAKKSR